MLNNNPERIDIIRFTSKHNSVTIYEVQEVTLYTDPNKCHKKSP